jgi:hypothetical protein
LEHLWNKIDHLKGDFGWFPGVRATESTRFMERAMGIKPTSEIFGALPLTCSLRLSFPNNPVYAANGTSV